MRVIICGAGQVGFSIAAYLSREDNDVTVIDLEPGLIAQVNEDLDANGIVGHASNPDILELAGASDADLLIAVTHSDEVNMVACQIAHALFGVPKKIARIREQSYLKPAWSNLFTHDHLPIDVVISPEKEVAKAIYAHLRVPGTTNIIALADEKAHLVGVRCDDTCPVANTPIKELTHLFPTLNITVAAIIRGNKPMIPDQSEQILTGDEVYFFVGTDHLQRALSIFGHEEREAHNIVVLGGGNIGMFLTSMLTHGQDRVRVKVVEQNLARAMYLSERLQGVSVLHGDGLDSRTMEDADIGRAETIVAVTDDDETNIMGALLAKQIGCKRAISLTNKNNYASLIRTMGIEAVISPRAITVSSIMQHVRRGRIKALHSLHGGFAEVIEGEVSDTASIANLEIRNIDLPRDVVIGAVVRDDDVLMPDPDLRIRPGDRVLVLAEQAQARRVAKMFLVHVDLF